MMSFTSSFGFQRDRGGEWKKYLPMLVESGRALVVEIPLETGREEEGIRGWVTSEHYSYIQKLFPSVRLLSGLPVDSEAFPDLKPNNLNGKKLPTWWCEVGWRSLGRSPIKNYQRFFTCRRMKSNRHLLGWKLKDKFCVVSSAQLRGCLLLPSWEQIELRGETQGGMLNHQIHSRQASDKIWGLPRTLHKRNGAIADCLLVFTAAPSPLSDVKLSRLPHRISCVFFFGGSIGRPAHNYTGKPDCERSSVSCLDSRRRPQHGSSQFSSTAIRIISLGSWTIYVSRGELSWGRLVLPLKERTPLQSLRPVNPTSLSPVCFFLREDSGWLVPLARKGNTRGRGETPQALSAVGRDVFQHLESRGASFFVDIRGATGHLPAQIESALWELVAAGLVTADGFDNLRALP